MEIASLSTLLTEYGPFVALVVWIIWENSKRESNYQSRETEFINETRKREEKYIEREEKYIEREKKYIEVIESFTKSFEEIREDVSFIKGKVSDKDEKEENHE